MSVAEDWNAGAGFLGMPPAALPVTNSLRPLHRISEIRRRQGVSLRSVARRMGTSMEKVRRQEEATSDMTLSDLYQWQESLKVPIAELLVELDAPLSEPVLTRARLLKIMKTARAIKEVDTSESIQRLCQMLEEQLIELMPELKDVGPWHSVGQRRTQDELGRIADRTFPDSYFSDGVG